MDDIAKIKEKLAVASNMIFAKNPAIVDELWSDGFRLVGSEVGEIATTRAELEYFINYIYQLQFQLRWDWDTIEVTVEDNHAWAFAQGKVNFVGPATLRVPYRLMAVFRRDSDNWQWRVYSGSEPEPLRKWR